MCSIDNRLFDVYRYIAVITASQRIASDIAISNAEFNSVKTKEFRLYSLKVVQYITTTFILDSTNQILKIGSGKKRRRHQLQNSNNVGYERTLLEL